MMMVRAHAQRDGREQLVRDPEQRPERVDAAERIDHALIGEVAPARDNDG